MNCIFRRNDSTRHTPGGYTFVEMLVAAAVIGVFLPALFTILNTGLTLFAKNHSLNQTHTQARMGIERMIEKVQSSAERPRLTSATGVAISGEGPAAGIRFWRYIPAAYELAADLSATDLVMKFKKKAGEPPISAGNMILFPDIGFQAIANSVQIVGTNYEITLADSAGNFLKTPTNASVNLPVSTGLLNSIPKCRVVEEIAFIANGKELRFYPKASNLSHYSIVTYVSATPGTPVDASTGVAQAFPFRYADSNTTNLELKLRVTVNNSSRQRATSFPEFVALQSSVSLRSPDIIRNGS